MIARSTIDTAVKIIRTEKPSYLFSKFVRNKRNTAFLQPLRKGISSEGFINRSKGLLNKMGRQHWKLIRKRNLRDKCTTGLKEII